MMVAQVGLQTLLGEVAAAKRAAADFYEACLEFVASDVTRQRIAGLVAEKREQAARLAATLDVSPPSVTLEGRPDFSRFDSRLMLAFALDQAATAVVIAYQGAADPSVSEVASALVAAEGAHQATVLAELRAAVEAEPEAGLRLAREMVLARDWIKAIFPRRERVLALVEAGILQDGAAAAHDGFLSSLGDRIQEALGVLGDL
jgi:hypothetical protein